MKNRVARLDAIVMLCCSALTTLVCGCAQHRLQMHTNIATKTLTDLYYQMVLDNLAMFLDNAHAIPHLMTPTNGSVQLQEGGQVDGKLTWLPSEKATRAIGLTAKSTLTVKWDVKPISDPKKLRAVQSLYQALLEKHGLFEESQEAVVPSFEERLSALDEISPSRGTKAYSYKWFSQKASGNDYWGGYAGSNVFAKKSDRQAMQGLGEFTLGILDLITKRDEARDSFGAINTLGIQ